MGNKDSKPVSAPQAEKAPANNDGATEDEKKLTETQMDSIEVTEVLLPVLGKIFHVHFGLVNTVQEEMDRLIIEHRLNIDSAECQLVLHEGEGSGIVMDREQYMEFYKDKLTSSCNTVQLIHNAPAAPSGTPNLGSLGVEMRD